MKILEKNKFILNDVEFVCKMFNYRNSVLSGFKNKTSNVIDENNPSYDLYTFFKSIYDYCINKKNNKNAEKIKIIISNFITVDLIIDKLMNESEFIDKYSGSIIPIHILLKNNFFSSSINTNSKMSRLSNGNKKNYKFNIEESASEQQEGVITGYRMLARKSNNLTGGARKSKGAKKPSKKSSRGKGKKLSREVIQEESVTEEVNNVDTLGDDILDDTESEVKEEKDVIKRHKKTRELEEAERHNQEISPDEENENDDLMSEGDDERDATPLDTEPGVSDEDEEEDGMRYRKKAKSKYKAKSKGKKSSKIDSDSESSLGLGLELESDATLYEGKSNKKGKKQNKKDVDMGPLGNLLKNVNKNGIFQVPGELQGMFDENQIMAMNRAMGPESDGEADMGYGIANNFGNGMGAAPQIADAGLSRLLGVNSAQGPQVTHPALAQFGPLGAPPSSNPFAGMGGLGSAAGMGGMGGMGAMGAMGGLGAMGAMGGLGGMGGMGAMGNMGSMEAEYGAKSVESGESALNNVSSALNNTAPTTLITPSVSTPSVSTPSTSTPSATGVTTQTPVTSTPAASSNTTMPTLNSVSQAGGAKKKKNFFLIRK